ncbi:MAG: mechanosensitive ion channel [Eubacteriales bacterium]|nr:mechanosensitive ion channel [Eubacteriales bacterium]MDD4460816.1 mechanosensitive ion channel [Eubacteriales bacterium]
MLPEIVTDFFVDLGLSQTLSDILSTVTFILGYAFIGLAAWLFVRFVLLRVLSHYIRNNRFKWDNVLLDQHVFLRISWLIPPTVLYVAAPLVPALITPLQRIATIWIIAVSVSVVFSLLNFVNEIYTAYDISRQKPIKGFIQAIKIFIFVVGVILILAAILNQSPVILLSGIGAMTAIIILIFQDSILGMVAGIQLASNDMVRIGDWIEMPRYHADGDVVEISLTTVKVANFDRTITTIPPRALVTDAFINWRGMVETGGRRIKRSLHIDMSSVGFLSQAQLADLRRIELLRDYIDQRSAEIADYNRQLGCADAHPANGRHMTNIGTFRAYIIAYLRDRRDIRDDMIQMVRQLPPEASGLPLEIYVFAATTVWAEYEQIQSDVFDHLLAVAPYFGLRVFQSPGGFDLHRLAETAREA